MRRTVTVRFIVPLLVAATAGCASNPPSNPPSNPDTPADSAASNPARASSGASSGASSAAMTGTGYAITPSEGWTNNSAALAGTADRVLSAPPRDQFAANLNVVIGPAAAGETLEGAKAQLPLAYPKMFTRYAQVKQGDLSMDGAAGISNTATYESGTPPRKIWMHQAFVIRNNKVYTFTCTALDANHGDYEADFESMLNSVKWTG